MDTMKYEYNLKGLGQPKCYLGGDMEIGKDGTMAWLGKTYIENVMESHWKLS